MEKAGVGTKSNLKAIPMAGSMENMLTWNDGNHRLTRDSEEG